jgi:hypothetical protein
VEVLLRADLHRVSDLPRKGFHVSTSGFHLVTLSCCRSFVIRVPEEFRIRIHR